ncbi:hypothetical protein B0H14DRAFT_2865369 [Mycena olivaceomarginata]|nr:hypothetical protein B0H14DRAFT_2865369 [Mycena olivaceomarginata]
MFNVLQFFLCFILAVHSLPTPDIPLDFGINFNSTGSSRINANVSFKDIAQPVDSLKPLSTGCAETIPSISSTAIRSMTSFKPSASPRPSVVRSPSASESPG